MKKNMRLGNSNGNNRGKKYFVRGRDDQNLDVMHAEKAVKWENWFADNCVYLQRDLKGKNGYDGDVFGDTYLRIYDIILHTGRVIKDFASYFHRAYYTNFIQWKTQKTRYCELYPNHDREDDEQGAYLEEIEEKNQLLGVDVMAYVYDRYELNEFEIFKMYVNLKPAVNYQLLARMMDCKYHVIQSMISRIMMDLRENEDFVRRRGELTAA